MSFSSPGDKTAKHENSRGFRCRAASRAGRVKLAMLHVVALAPYTMARTRGWAVNGRIARVRLKAENDKLKRHR